MKRSWTILLFLALRPHSLSGQHGKPTGIPDPLPVKRFDDKVTSVAVKRLSSFDELATKGGARHITPNELASLRALHSMALKTQATRTIFITALQDYQKVLFAGGSELDREQAYFTVGTTARNLLEDIGKLNQKGELIASELDLHHQNINDEVVAYENQSYVVNKELISKKQLLGMTYQQVSDLIKKLEKTGDHLTFAIASLRSAILQAEAQ